MDLAAAHLVIGRRRGTGLAFQKAFMIWEACGSVRGLLSEVQAW
jgi:hypothetical protein